MHACFGSSGTDAQVSESATAAAVVADRTAFPQVVATCHAQPRRPNKLAKGKFRLVTRVNNAKGTQTPVCATFHFLRAPQVHFESWPIAKGSRNETRPKSTETQ
eukprot:581457-Amphidinium_carterae.1